MMQMGTKLFHFQNMEEDKDGEHQQQFQQTNKNIQPLDTQQKNTQCIQNYHIPQNPQPIQTQSFNVPDRYTEQI